MFERGLRDGEFEEQVDLRHEGFKVIDERHANHAQAYNLADVLADGRMPRALEPSRDFKVVTLMNEVDNPPTHFPGCPCNRDTHVRSPSSVLACLCQTCIAVRRLPLLCPPPTSSLQGKSRG